MELPAGMTEKTLQEAMAHLFAMQRNGIGSSMLPPVNLANPFHGKKASSDAILAHIAAVLSDKDRREAFARDAVAACEVESKTTYAVASHRPEMMCHDHLTRTTLEAAAKGKDSAVMVFRTGCCTKLDCPQARFMQHYANAIAKGL